MPGFTTSFLFPDINVWLALTHGRHVHHLVANDWLSDLDGEEKLFFCRLTQLGFLRLLTTDAVMGVDVLTQAEAWSAFDGWLKNDRVTLLDEPHGFDRRFRALTSRKQPSNKTWGDAYLAAFAEGAQLTLVTFDAGFRGKVKPLILLAEDTED